MRATHLHSQPIGADMCVRMVVGMRAQAPSNQSESSAASSRISGNESASVAILVAAEVEHREHVSAPVGLTERQSIREDGERDRLVCARSTH